MPISNGKYVSPTWENGSTPAINASELQAITNTVSGVDNALTNRNLLDNWYFVGGGSHLGGGKFPINQRGQTSYVAGYGIDRWRVPADTTIALESGGMHLTATAVEKQFQQFLENYDILDGEMLTASILWGDGTLNSGTITYDNSTTSWNTNTFFYAKGLRILITKNHGFDIVTNQSTVDVVIAAVKLELGSTQTLAHQENGVWILNELPNYQQELAKCQRYQFQVAPNNLSAGDYLIAGTGVLTALGQSSKVFVPTPVTMAKKPTVTFDGTWFANAKEDGNPITNIIVDGWSNSGITVNVSHVAMNGDSVTLESFDGNGFIPTGKILFDANL